MSKKIKLAIITDPLKTYGGLERLLLGILELYPESFVYTPFYKKESLPKEFSLYTIVESKYASLLKKIGPLAVLLYPLSFESFSFLDDFDICFSITSGFAKDINTKNKPHISYIMTPPRFLWNLPNSNQDRFRFKKILLFINNTLRLKDFYSSQLPQRLLSISVTVQKRIKKFYRRDSFVLYPFVDTELFNINSKYKDGDYFIIISRLEKYKNIETVIDICNKLKLKLIIVGRGSYQKYLESIANRKYIKFLGYIKDRDMIDMINASRALIFPTAEDFGLVPVEALACGKSVIAYNKDGASEVIVDKSNGYLYNTKHELENILINFDSSLFDRYKLRESSMRFSKEVFRKELNKILESYE